MHKFNSLPFLLAFSLFFACPNQDPENTEELETSSEESARITAVECIGQPDNYTFNVTIASPDTGCEQYANWWEVITPEGELIYRRILGHSHVNEQPFTRSGGPIAIGPNDPIIVRAHMNNLGYGTQVFRGVIMDDGLVMETIDADFAIDLENVAPLPGDCPF